MIKCARRILSNRRFEWLFTTSSAYATIKARSNSENETMEMEKSPHQPLFEFQEVDGTKSTVKVQQGHFKMVIASQFVVTRIKSGSDYVSILNHHHVLLGSTTNALGFMDLAGTL
mgnify:CR=1 FL=1